MASIDAKRAGEIIAFLDRPENAGIGCREAARRLGTSKDSVWLARRAYKWGVTMKLNISRIRRDGGLQPRAEIDRDTVLDYAEHMGDGAVFPPVTVYYDGTSYWLADGFHRVEAAQKAGIKTLEADVKQGDRRTALLFAVGANGKHGLRRTNADKQRVVLTLLNDAEWHQWSDSEISRRCNVAVSTVSRIRPQSHFSNAKVTERKTVNKHGQETTIKTANIGRKSAESNGHHPKPTKTVVEDKSPDFDDEDFCQEEPDEPEDVQAEPESEPAGKSIINGVLQDDDAEIADQRRRGTMPAGVVPVVTINDPATFPAPPPPEREPGDQEPETVEEWLGTLPLYRRLSGKPQKLFVAAAKLYYRLRPHREVFRVGAAESLKGLSHDNELAYFLKSYLKVGNPKYWPVCPPTKEGGCDGIGQLPGIDEVCPMCRGRGFRCREAQ